MFTSLLPTLQVPPKFVKFYDESTLERRQRKEKISNEHEPTTKNRSIAGPTADTTGEGTLLEDSLTRYHSEGPEAGQWNGIESRSRSGMELKLDSDMEPRPMRRMFSEIPPEEEVSLTSLGSQIDDEVYQLFLLWRGVWTSLNQQKARLEATLEVWKNFEEKKEEFCDFLTKAEDRNGVFFKSLSECKDLTVVQTEITAQMVSDCEGLRHVVMCVSV